MIIIIIMCNVRSWKRRDGSDLCVCFQEHTKGDYQKALLSLCGGDDWKLFQQIFSVLEPLLFSDYTDYVASVSLNSFRNKKNFSPVCVWLNDHQRAAETHA